MFTGIRKYLVAVQSIGPLDRVHVGGEIVTQQVEVLGEVVSTLLASQGVEDLLVELGLTEVALLDPLQHSEEVVARGEPGGVGIQAASEAIEAIKITKPMFSFHNR